MDSKHSKTRASPSQKDKPIHLLTRVIQVLKENDYRILKLLIFFIVSHEGAAGLYFDRWYKDPAGIAQKKRMLIEKGIINEDLAEIDLLTQNGDKPAEMLVAMMHGVINTVLAYKVRKIDSMKIKRSVCDPTYTNSERSKLLMDIHIAFWTYSLYLIMIKKTGTKASLMIMHHFLSMLYPLLMRSEDYCGHLWCSISYLSESPTIIASMAAILRIYHEIFLNHNGTDESSMLTVSNLCFLLFVVSFSYIRTVEFTRIAIPAFQGIFATRITDSDDHNHGRILHPLTKFYSVSVFFPMVFVGYYWSYRGIRRLILDISAQLYC